MLILEKNGASVEYDYSISGYDLTITPKNPSQGTYYLYLSGYDLLNNKYLLSTTGNQASTFGLEFTATGKVSNGTNDTPTQSDTTPQPIVVLDDSPVTVTYTKLLNTAEFVQTFSSAIAKPFKIYVTIDRIDGEASTYTHDVTDTSESAFFVQNELHYIMPTYVNNQIVYITTSEIEFENGRKDTFEFIALTTLKPYINVRHVGSQLGKYYNEITDADIYYASISQMVVYEKIIGETIIGKTIIDSKTRLFLKKYQYYELLTLLLNRKMLSSGNQVNTGVASVTFGRVNQSQIDFLKAQKDELIREYLGGLSPISQNKSEGAMYPANTKALQQIKAWEEIFGYGGEI